MARPSRIEIVNGSAAWDADVNDNFENLFDTPFPIARYANTAAFPAAASYENCVVIAQDTDKLYISDGSSWAMVGGASTFLALTDTPANFTGSGGYKVKVNSGETALEFVADAGDVNAYSKKKGRFPTIQSTDQVTGMRWTDDAQLYIKFVDQGVLTNNSTKITAHGAASVNKIRDSWLVVCDSSAWDGDDTYEVQGIHSWTLNSRLYADATNCRLRTSWNASAHYGKSFIIWDKTSGGGTTDEEGVMDYSTSEQETGWNWTDGRTVYVKTVDTGAYPNATSKSVAHSITNLDRVIYFTAQSETSSYQYTQPQGFDTDSIDIRISSTNVVIQTTTDRSTHTASNITIYYVKDENDAGLGEFRGPDFSETEQKAGFLMGTKEVYFKIIDCGALPNNTTKTVEHGISNFYNLVRLKGATYDGSTTMSWHDMPLTVLQNGADDGVIVRVNRSAIEIVSQSDMTRYSDTHLILYYTKELEDIPKHKVAWREQETPTGDLWSDGSPIYRMVVNTGALPNNTTKTMNHNIPGNLTIANLIRLDGVAMNTTSGSGMSLPHVAGSLAFQVNIDVTATQVRITTYRDFTAHNASYITFLYTK